MRAVGASRQEELLHDCAVSPQVFDHLVDRLRNFVVSYQHCLETEAGQRNVHLYLEGLLSHLSTWTQFFVSHLRGLLSDRFAC
jgi:hypothetical protein